LGVVTVISRTATSRSDAPGHRDDPGPARNARTHNLLLTEVARRVVVERGFARQLLDIQVR